MGEVGAIPEGRGMGEGGGSRQPDMIPEGRGMGEGRAAGRRTCNFSRYVFRTVCKGSIRQQETRKQKINHMHP